MAVKNRWSITLSLAMNLNFDQQYNPKSYVVKLSKNGGSIQDGGSNSEFLA
jgi:hypothetical protein